MTAISNNYNKEQYSLIYSRWKRVQRNCHFNVGLRSETKQITINDITYDDILLNKPTYFYDGAPGHILTVEDLKIAKKFKSIQEAKQTLDEKFQNTFHEGECQNIHLIDNKIDFIFTPENQDNKHKIVHRFELYKESQTNTENLNQFWSTERVGLYTITH